MKRFIIIITALIILTLVWLAIIINAASFYLDFDNESKLIFKNVTIQFKVIYITGAMLFLSYAYMLISQKFNNFF